MNSKLAKRLRRAAKDSAPDLPDRDYAIDQRGQVTHKYGSTRGLYREFKRQAKSL